MFGKQPLEIKKKMATGIAGLFVELVDAQLAGPGTFWGSVEGRREAVHVVTAVAIIAEQ